MILILFLSLMKSKEVCEIGDGLRLVEFYKGKESDLMEPKVNLISKITKTSKLPFEVQKINCGLCDCQGVKDFPSFRLLKNHQVLDSFTGYKLYDDLIKFILKSKEVDLFKPMDVSGDLIELKERDFYSGFDGPWLILFYNEDKKEINRLLKQVLKIFKGRIKIGKVKHSESKDFISRYQIKTFPTIYGMYEGLNVPYLGQFDLKNLLKFTNRLIEPAFSNLNYNELISISRDSEPVYVVLHQNENLANETFLRYAHNFKFKTRLFKTEDPEIFKRVGIKYYHKESEGDKEGIMSKGLSKGDKEGLQKGDIRESKEGTGLSKGDKEGTEKGDIGEVKEKGTRESKEGTGINDHHSLKNNLHLAVFKNGHFHLYDGNVHNEGTLVEWIFHTHFPNVTKISDSTFHSIFNGIKPVFLLLTENDFLTQNLEIFARNVHLGKPFFHLIFSSINLDEFMLFTASLLPKIEIPTIVIYNPKDKKFYHKKKNLNEFNFKEVAEESLKLFDQGKLKVYGSKNHKIYYLIGDYL